MNMVSFFELFQKMATQLGEMTLKVSYWKGKKIPKGMVLFYSIVL